MPFASTDNRDDARITVVLEPRQQKDIRYAADSIAVSVEKIVESAAQMESNASRIMSLRTDFAHELNARTNPLLAGQGAIIEAVDMLAGAGGEAAERLAKLIDAARNEILAEREELGDPPDLRWIYALLVANFLLTITVLGFVLYLP